MTSPPDREIAVFNAARRLLPGERAAYLDETCAGDSSLRQRVEELLEAGEEAGAFLAAPASEAQRLLHPPGPEDSRQSRLIGSAPSESVGDRIGRYKLLQQIGEGGCGVVYMAEQTEPIRRHVALKVIKLGMDTKQVMARFEAERQALALMDHPNIAKVLDAGATQSGRPYFVMELVRGIRITDYCDENNLSTEQRLNLFLQVCHAIQHAHQKGIIHRDIKPSNVLVADHDGVPIPKIIDFGIAKATTDQRLTDKTLFTALEQFLGTPAYMSPEQAKLSGLDIDTRSDIYSLGVLLYELLTGQTPFDAKELLAAGLDEMRRTIREQEPARPSTRLSTMLAADLTGIARHRRVEPAKLPGLIRGDLDWIVMKALEKDRTRRYETANGLAMDVQRQLNNEPVVARPPSGIYRLRKLVRRNKLVFATATLVAASLVIGLGVSTWMYFNTRAEKRKAQSEAAKATAISDFLQQMLSSANPDALKGSAYTVRQMLDDFAAGLENQFKDQPEVEAEVRATLGRAYYGLGLADKSQPQMERALLLQRRLFGEHEQVAATLTSYAWTSFEQGQFAKGESQAREALDIYRKRGATGQPAISALFALQRTLIAAGRVAEVEAVTEEASSLARKSPGVGLPDLASMLHGLAELRVNQSQYAEAEALALKAVGMHRRLRPEGDLQTAWALVALGSALRGEQKLDEAEQAFREALGIFRKQYAAGHKSVDEAMGQLRAVLEAKRDFAGLVALNVKTLAEQRTALGNDHPDVADTLLNLADALQAQGKQAEAEKAAGEALDIALKAKGQITARLPALLRREAQALKRLGKSPEAEKLFENAITLAHQKLGETNLILGELLHDYGEFLKQEDKFEAAAEYHLKSLPIRRTQPGDNLAWTLRSLGIELAQASRPREAEPYLRQSLTLYHQLHPQEDDANATSWPTIVLGDVLCQQHRWPEAEQAYREELAACTKRGAVGSEQYARVLRSLLDVLKQENKLPEAEALCQELLAQRRAASTNDNLSVAVALIDLAGALQAQGKQAEAEKALVEVLLIRRRALQREPGRSDNRVELGHLLWQLGQRLRASGRPAEALPVFEEALQVFGDAARDFPAEPFLRQEQAYNRRLLGDLLGNNARVDEAERHYRGAIAIYAVLKAEVSGSAHYHQEEAFTSWMLALMLDRAGRLDPAAVEYRRAIALHEKAMALFPGEKELKPRWNLIRASLDSLLVSQAKPPEDEAFHLERLAELRKTLEQSRKAAESGDVQALNEIAWQLSTCSFPELRDGPAAVSFAESAVASTNRKDPMILDTLAAAYAECGAFTKAVSIQKEALALVNEEKVKADFGNRLKFYESNSPWHPR